MTGIRPETLDLIGFIESAKIYLSEFQERFKINCQFESDISKLDMSTRQLVALFRILQERILLLEGELFIIGQIDQGTTVRIEIPYLIPKPSR